MNLFHYLFAKILPLLRFVYEKLWGWPWFSEITPQLWLSGAPMYERDYLFMEDKKITAVINIRAEEHDDIERYKVGGVTYLQIPVLDMLVPTFEQLDEAVVFIDEHIRKGGIVDVHCAKGRSRSATLIAAYFMKKQGLSYDEAFALLNQKRRLTKLEGRHRRLLEKWSQNFILQS